MAHARDSLAVSGEAERLIEGLALALRYPQAKLVFSGHSASLLASDLSEADVNERFVDMMRFDRSRVIMEQRSRNTYENALFSRELLAPAPDDAFILVTSAAHMPRSMGIFQKLGWQVIPWPVDYKTEGSIPVVNGDLALGDSLSALDLVLREWIGLTAYYWLGRTSAWLPGPLD